MKTEEWKEWCRRAEARLPHDFRDRVLERTAAIRRGRRQNVAALTALLLALSATAATAGWHSHREHQKNLAQWRNLAAVALALDKGL